MPAADAECLCIFVWLGGLSMIGMFGDDLGCLGALVEALARFFRSLSTGTAFPETFACVDFNLGIRKFESEWYRLFLMIRDHTCGPAL